jgi:hypothetical protein
LVHISRALDGPLTKAFPSLAKLLGASRKTRIGKGTQHPATRVARMLGRADTEVYACLKPRSAPILEPASSGFALLIASDFDAEICNDETLWTLANTLAPAAMGCGSMSRLPGNLWIAVIAAAVRTQVSGFLERETQPLLSPDVAERLDSALGRKTLEPMLEDLKDIASMDYDKLEVQFRLFQIAFARLAALANLDTHAALREVAITGPGPTCARAMIPFLLNPDFEELQRAAGTAPDPDSQESDKT